MKVVAVLLLFCAAVGALAAAVKLVLAAAGLVATACCLGLMIVALSKRG